MLNESMSIITRSCDFSNKRLHIPKIIKASHNLLPDIPKIKARIKSMRATPYNRLNTVLLDQVKKSQANQVAIPKNKIRVYAMYNKKEIESMVNYKCCFI